MGSLADLSWGACRFCSKRRRRKNLRNLSVELEDLVLIGSRSEPNQWVLCRHVGESLADVNDAILGYNESVRVTFSAPTQYGMETIFDLRCAAAPISSSDRLTSEVHASHSSFEKHLKLSSLNTSDSILIATPRVDSAVAVSIACTVRLSTPEIDSSRPLLLAALKRQLMGSVVAFSTEQQSQVRTTLSLSFRGHLATFTVSSVLFDRDRQNRPPMFFWILPSTRITLDLLEDDHDKRLTYGQTQDRDPTSHLSYAARFLIQVMTGALEQPMLNLSRTLLLTGPPGVGKTHAVRQVVRHFEDSANCRVDLLSLHGSEIMTSGYASEAALTLQRTFETAVQSIANVTNALVVIFLDECEALVSNETIAGMLAYLLDRSSNEWTRLILVAATNRVDDIPATLRRPGRLDKEIPLSPPSSIERQVILQSLLDQYELTGGEKHRMALTKEELRDVAEECVGFVPADLDLVVRRAAEMQLVDTTTQSSLMELLTQSLSTVGASALRDAVIAAPPKTSWDDIGGDPGGAKTSLRQAIEWPRTKRVAFARLGLSTPRGILLYGPPGCAKSSLARAAAAATSVTFLSFAPADVYASSYVGDAEAVIRRGFSLARSAAPCILFFDEIDAVVGFDSDDGSLSGHSGGEGVHGMGRGRSAEARVLSTFLNEMDGVDGSGDDGVLVLGATNRPWTLDAALMRPGRFDKIIYVPPPDEAGRRSILEMQCCHWEKDIPFDFAHLASDEISGGLTGAEIVGACRETAMRAFGNAIQQGGGREPVLTQCDLERSLLQVQPLLSNEGVMREFIAFEQSRT